MLIRCGKCGKMYDYEKCNGICPKCARYNRPESREEMEQSLHDRYDEEEHPGQHNWYRESQPSSTEHRKTSDTAGFYGSTTDGDRKQKQDVQHESVHRVKLFVTIIVIVVIAIAAIGMIAGSSMLFQNVKSTVENGWNVNDQGYDQAEEEIAPECQNRIYVDYAWADCLGEDLSEIDWDSYVDDYFLEATETEKKELSELSAETGYTYYLLTVDIQNNLSDLYNLSYLTEQDIQIWKDEESISAEDDPSNDCTVEKLFTISYPEMESGDSNYVEVLIRVPDDLEEVYGSCLLNGNQEAFECYLYD